ncbi:MAG: sigma-70 family RNA polymerase sigma factor [Bacteroidetes bacterium]|nr:sigma-70 family RNA polymerase sigma factor [Bacteroidota bacterium]MBL6942762.1 sigma-70 family RNA polymerase sigma factor [Bacteroidales bacterium]
MQIDSENIINNARNGDKEAFGKLVLQHQQYAFNLAFRIVCNEDDAKDIVQDSFIKIWKNMKLYHTKIKFTTWMYKIVSNTAIDQLRLNKKMDMVNIDDYKERYRQNSVNTPETLLSNRETGQLISLYADTLSEKQRLVFVLRDLQGLKSSEVEGILALPETTVKSNLYHARKAIGEKLHKILSYERSIR